MFHSTIRSFILLFALLACAVQAQGVDDNLSKLAGSAGKAYISPIVTGVGLNLNSGWLTTAPLKKKFGFDLEFGFVGMSSSFDSKSNERFSVASTFRFNKSQAQELTIGITDAATRTDVINQLIVRDMPVVISGATIVGNPTNHVKVLFGPNGGETFSVAATFPVTVTLPSKEIDLGVGGVAYGLEAVPGAAPQLKLGTLFGTRAVVRMLPEVSAGDSVGKFSYYGFGLEHNLSYWFDFMPVDVSAGFLTQTAKLGKSVEFSATSYGLNVSRRFGLGGWFSIAPYAGYMMETTNMKVNFTQQLDTPTGKQDATVSFDVEGAGKSRVTVGANIKLLFLGLNFEYAAAKDKTMSAALMFVF